MVKTVVIAGACSVGAFAIGYHIGYNKCENNVRPQIKILEKRVKYLEADNVK